ncbi:hypothetical protein PMAN_a6000 [Pseudoalteromonas marina]|nr:hypothetical protein PMAN_a6000 [Pseudoalteromonas marina]
MEPLSFLLGHKFWSKLLAEYFSLAEPLKIG